MKALIIQTWEVEAASREEVEKLADAMNKTMGETFRLELKFNDVPEDQSAIRFFGTQVFSEPS